ncbi:MAG: peptidase [Candidatus Zixiibacteriota bacterium]
MGGLILFLSLLAIAGCSSSTAPPSDWIVEGVNLTELFAPPTEAEIEAVQSDWESREPGIADSATVKQKTVSAGALFDIRIVAHRVDGAIHYGAICTPVGSAARSKAVLMYCHGGDDGEDIDDLLFLLNLAFGGVPDDFVYVIPSFRSEPIHFDNMTYVSEGDPSPWDRDVDDAMALLSLALASEPAADPERVGVIGFSRGACVGMLMAIRDPRVDLVVEYFGPVDFFGGFVQGLTANALKGDLRALPGLADLNESLIQPLKNGELTYEAVRLAMLRRSPVYFAEMLPPLQLHHGTADITVPVSEAERLIEVMTELGRTPPEFESYLYQGGGHTPLLPGSLDRALDFLERLVPPASLARYRTGGVPPL